jgi:multidrug efflux pump subunit AcrB/outer membrane protein TolC
VLTLLVLFGGYSLYVMPRQEFPTFTIRQGLVIGVYPGATSAEVEKQLSEKVEKYLYSFKEIKKQKTYSVSKDGMMVIYVELNDDVKNSNEFWSKLNDGLNTFKSQLPAGVLALFTNSDFGDTSALLIAVEADGKSYRELGDYVDELESRLRRIESVSKLRHYGVQNEQISVYLEPEKLSTYGISSSTLLANLFSQGFKTSSGKVENQKVSMPVHISEAYKSEKDIEEQIVYADASGNIIRLKDIARVVREYPEPESYITYNGRKCMLISMEMQSGNNIVEYGNEVDKVLAQFQSEMPSNLHISRIADQPKVVGDSISSFLREFFIAIAAVILVTMLLLPLRVATVAATSIPLTIFATLGVMYGFGIELNTVTLAALIVVLGMIVDNSIVIVDSYLEKLDRGQSRWHAAISSAQGFFKAIFSATLAISITFFPFLFTLKGTFNDFVQLFPWTVTIALGISLLVAMMVIPFLEYAFIQKGFHQAKQHKRSLLDVIQDLYEKYLHKAFHHPKITIGVGALAIIIGISLFFLIPQRILPIAERNQFAVEIYLPQGSSLDQTGQVADSLENLLMKDSRTKSVTAFVGTSSPRFHTTYAPNFPEKCYAQFIVNTGSNRETEDMLDEYSSKYSRLFTNAYIRFKQLDYQFVAAPIEVRVSGNNIDSLKRVADSLMLNINKVEGICWVRTNFKEMLPGYNVAVNSVEANRLGISKSTVSTNLAVNFSDMPLTTLWEGDYAIPVKLKMDKNSEASAADFDKVYVHSVIPGVSVPLRQIADVKPEWTQGQVVRRNGVLTITVMADVTRGYNTNEVFSKVEKVVDATVFPQGTSHCYGGAYEADGEAMPQILSGLFISIFIIFLILLFHFRKINLALLVLSSAALTIVGATVGGLLLNIEFGITSILGIVSLIGILVRNGIIMLDYAENLRINQGMSTLDAAMEAGKRRMRPIFLTSAAASMGVIPMIISKSALWAPMGTVICFGTMISMVLLIFILPVSYWLIFERTDKMKARKAGISYVKPVLATVAMLLMFNMSGYSQKIYSLDSCKRMALTNNAAVKNAQLEVEASQQVKKEAFTKYFPTVSAMAMGMKSTDPLIDMNVPGGFLPVFKGQDFSLPTGNFAYSPGMSISLLDKGLLGAVNVTQPVFAGGRIMNGNKMAAIGENVSNSKLILSKNEVLLKTEQQYWQVVSLREKRATIKLVMSLLDTLYYQADNAFKAGLINRNDVMKVTLKKKEIEMENVRLENGIALSTMALCQYMGVPYDPQIELSDTLTSAQDPEQAYIEANKALANREEYKLLDQSVKYQELQTKMKRGEYMPEIGVGISAQYIDYGASDPMKVGMAFASVKIPISGWWEGSHAIKEQRIKEQIARNNSQNNTELLTLQMQQAWNNLDEAYKQVAITQEAISQSQENLRLNTDNYQSGIVNISDMIESQMLLQQARNQYTDALLNYRVQMINYQQVTGRYQLPQ